MNKPTKHWSATLTALALTLTAPAFGQESTGDPFLDAMMMDQQAAQEDTTPATKTQGNAFDEAVARKQAAAKKAAEQDAAYQALLVLRAQKEATLGV